MIPFSKSKQNNIFRQTEEAVIRAFISLNQEVNNGKRQSKR